MDEEHYTELCETCGDYPYNLEWHQYRNYLGDETYFVIEGVCDGVMEGVLEWEGEERSIHNCITCDIDEYESRETCSCIIILKCIDCGLTTEMERSDELYIDKRMEWMSWHGDWTSPLCDDCDMVRFSIQYQKKMDKLISDRGAVRKFEHGSNKTCGSWAIQWTEDPKTGELVTFNEPVMWHGPSKPIEEEPGFDKHGIRTLPVSAFLGGDEEHSCDLCKDDRGYQLAKKYRPRMLTKIQPQLMFLDLANRHTKEAEDIEWHREDR